MGTLKEHWDRAHTSRQPTQVSWYQPHLQLSLELIGRAAPKPGACIIDVGGGASTLVDDLLDRGFTAITVLDISSEALKMAKARLGERAQQVSWIEADITGVELPARTYDLWHDRAVFHFLTTPEQRGRYLKVMREALKPRGHVILATFSVNGPPRCSGLEVARYSPEALCAELGQEFELLEARQEEHCTPFGAGQAFIYCRFQRMGPEP